MAQRYRGMCWNNVIELARLRAVDESTVFFLVQDLSAELRSSSINTTPGALVDWNSFKL